MMLKNKYISYLIGVSFLLTSLYAVNPYAKEEYIQLDIGECILNVPLHTMVGVSNDYDATFLEMETNEIYNIRWKENILNHKKKDLHQHKIKIRQDKHLKIIDIEDSSYSIIVGKHFYIHALKDSDCFKRHLVSCNNTWEEDVKDVRIDIETMIDEFHINDKSIKILQDVNKNIYGL